MSDKVIFGNRYTAGEIKTALEVGEVQYLTVRNEHC
jgi:hypothetical protein